MLKGRGFQYTLNKVGELFNLPVILMIVVVDCYASTAKLAVLYKIRSTILYIATDP